MNILGIIGKKEVGKSTFASLLEEEFEKNNPERRIFLICSFATELKRIMEEGKICTHEELYGKKTETSRFLMQKIGTEVIRGVDPDYFCKVMWEKLRETYRHEPTAFVVIDDVRFTNEALLIKSLGGVLIRIWKSDSSQPKDEHISENGQESIACNWFVSNNKRIEDLRLQACATINLINRQTTHLSDFSKQNIRMWVTPKRNSKFTL